MTYWSDDRHLLIEQRRLDAQQAEALRRIEARRKREAESMGVAEAPSSEEQ